MKRFFTLFRPVGDKAGQTLVAFAQSTHHRVRVRVVLDKDVCTCINDKLRRYQVVRQTAHHERSIAALAPVIRVRTTFQQCLGDKGHMMQGANHQRRVPGFVVLAVGVGTVVERMQRGRSVCTVHRDKQRIRRCLAETLARFRHCFSFTRQPEDCE